MKHILLLFVSAFYFLTAAAQHVADKQAVLKVVREFFTHLETQDSIAFRKLLYFTGNFK